MKECIDSTFVSSVGEYVEKFEESLARYVNVKRVVLCVNGTSAIHLGLKLIGVEHGDEVLTQSLTFIATLNAIDYCGASPVFIDVNRKTLGMDPDSLMNYLTTNSIVNSGKCINKKTGKQIKACLPMHTFGNGCDIIRIKKICADFKIQLIEDAAEAMGSYHCEKHLGTFGEIGIVSFNGNKIITTGGGGAILTNNIDLADRAKHLSTQAKVHHDWEYIHDQVGYNYRMPNINAALGLAQLENLDSFITEKRKIANLYQEFFKSFGIESIKELSNQRSNYWLNGIFFENMDLRWLFRPNCQVKSIVF